MDFGKTTRKYNERKNEMESWRNESTWKLLWQGCELLPSKPSTSLPPWIANSPWYKLEPIALLGHPAATPCLSYWKECFCAIELGLWGAPLVLTIRFRACRSSWKGCERRTPWLPHPLYQKDSIVLLGAGRGSCPTREKRRIPSEALKILLYASFSYVSSYFPSMAG